MADTNAEQGPAGTPGVEVDGPCYGPGWHGRGKAAQGNGGGRYRLTGRNAVRSKERAGPGIVLPLIKDELSRHHGTPDPGRRQDVLHPSEMAKESWCPCAAYHKLAGTPARAKDSNFSMTLANVFAEGHSIHAKWQDWLARTGQLWGDWHCTRCMATVRRTADPGWTDMMCLGSDFRHRWEYQEVYLWDNGTNIHGHEDGALTGANALVEIKSVGLGTLRWENPELLANYYVRELAQYDLEGIWRAIKRPFPSHVRQVNIYMWLARQMGLPFDKTAVVYEFKINQQVKEFLVPYSPEIAEPLADHARDIAAARETGTAPSCIHANCQECRIYEPEEISPVPGPGERADSGDRPPAARVRSGKRRVQRGGLHEEPGNPAHGDGTDQSRMAPGSEGDGS
jgi:hypothetical protein